MVSQHRNDIKGPSLAGAAGRAPGGGGMHRFAPGLKPKDAKKTFRRIMRIYLRYGFTFFTGLLLTALSAGLTVAVPYFTGKSFNAFNVQTHTVDAKMLSSFILVIAVLYVGNWIASTINSLILLKLSQKLVFALRSEFFAKLQRLPLQFFDSRPHGDTMSRLTNDVDTISSTIATATVQLLSGTLSIGGSLAVMCALNLPLTGIVLLCIPFTAALTRLITKRSRSYFSVQQRSLGTLNGIIEESILGLKTVKAFGRQSAILDSFESVNEQLYAAGEKAQEWSGYMMPLMNVINNLIFALVAVTGGLFSTLYGLQTGTVVAFLGYSKQFAQPLNVLAGMFNTIQSALAGAERVFEVLDAAEESPDTEGAVELDAVRGDVVFEDVSFSYQPQRPVLEQVHFSVRAGETIALVGETGAGKTTIVNLLMRFYETDSGRILIDGIDIKVATKASLRRCFSVVLQDTCLFTGTILDNIRYARPLASEEEAIEAAKLACAHDFIVRLPQGYQTKVSGSSDTISQGQRQLLAITRAILCNSPILILDEATSSVDTKTEKHIQQAFLHIMQHHTCFLIAHRLSTIRDADRILVIGGGTILESGTHDSLMQKKGRYYAMVASQSGKSLETDS